MRKFPKHNAQFRSLILYQFLPRQMFEAIAHSDLGMFVTTVHLGLYTCPDAFECISKDGDSPLLCAGAQTLSAWRAAAYGWSCQPRPEVV